MVLPALLRNIPELFVGSLGAFFGFFFLTLGVKWLADLMRMHELRGRKEYACHPVVEGRIGWRQALTAVGIATVCGLTFCAMTSGKVLLFALLFLPLGLWLCLNPVPPYRPVVIAGHVAASLLRLVVGWYAIQWW